VVVKALILGMAVVVLAFLALAFTDSSRSRDARPRLRALAVAAWWAILLIGWGCVAYVALAVPGGMDAAVDWTAGQPQVMRAAMWLFLLPWMASIGIWELAWSEVARTACVMGVATLTCLLAVRLLTPTAPARTARQLTHR